MVTIIGIDRLLQWQFLPLNSITELAGRASMTISKYLGMKNQSEVFCPPTAGTRIPATAPRRGADSTMRNRTVAVQKYFRLLRISPPGCAVSKTEGRVLALPSS